MTEPDSPSRFLRGGSGPALSQIAKAVYEAVPFTRPEVVRLEGESQGVRMQVGPREYLLLIHTDGQWICGDVYIDVATGKPDSNPLVQRLMEESYRPLPIPGPGDLSDVAYGFLKRAIRHWTVTTEHAFAKEHERQFAAEALTKSSQFLNRKPPAKS